MVYPTTASPAAVATTVTDGTCVWIVMNPNGLARELKLWMWNGSSRSLIASDSRISTTEPGPSLGRPQPRFSRFSGLLRIRALAGIFTDSSVLMS